MTEPPTTRPLERVKLAAIGAAQGVAIWLLIETWPEAHLARAAAVAALTFVAVASLVQHFAWTGRDGRRLLLLSLGTGVVYAAVAGWVGWSMPVVEGLSPTAADRSFVWFLISAATLYVLGPFLQILQRVGRLRFEYEALFEHSWNNFFVALVGALFVGALWTVLVMWGQLFELIGIGFFADLFEEEAFVWPVSGAAVGFGIALGRESERVVSTLRGITLAVFRGLLPLVCGVAIVFIASLPFTGLETLWETNHAAQLLLTWVGLTLLFLNAVYQDGKAESRPPTWIRRIIEAGLLVMNGFVGIAAYGMSLRIDQYGLTPSRMWGVLVAVVLGGYAIGYGVAILRRQGSWLSGLRRVNLAIALVIVAIGLLAHTPVLDPVGWSVDSQIARLVDRRSPAAEFDYGYLRFMLGREGRAALDALEDLDSHPDIAAIREAVTRVHEAGSYWDWKTEHRFVFSREHFVTFPSSAELPVGVITAVNESRISAGQSCDQALLCGAFAAELDGHPPEEWILVFTQKRWTRMLVFEAVDDVSSADATYNYLGPLDQVGEQLPPEKLRELLEAGEFTAAEPIHQDVSIGRQRFRVVPR